VRFTVDENNSGKQLSLPLGWKVVREPEALIFLTPDLRTQERIPAGYEYSFALPGRAIVPEAGLVIEAVQVLPGQQRDLNDDGFDRLLDASLVSNPLRVRNWRAGDRFWPVVVSGDEIIWVRGLPAATKFRAKNENADAILIRAVPLQDEF
jgi:hypothetical protein